MLMPEDQALSGLCTKNRVIKVTLQSIRPIRSQNGLEKDLIGLVDQRVISLTGLFVQSPLSDVLPKRPTVGADPWADGRQGCTPGSLRGRVDAHTLRRAMIHRDTDGALTLLMRQRRCPSGSPHRLNLRGDNRPLMGLRALRVPLPRWGQHMVRTPQAQDPARRRAETARPPPGPPLTASA
jgi:hypothetical protein